MRIETIYTNYITTVGVGSDEQPIMRRVIKGLFEKISQKSINVLLCEVNFKLVHMKCELTQH